jgi:solute carrier family 66 (lysosomal lysine-arginine transporter), member 1
VVASGTIGFYLSRLYSSSIPHDSPDDKEIEISTLGQIFGWGCAVFYIGSRIPQVVKNFRRKSTEGLSFLFFLFACLGNITYVLSIISASLDPRYLLVNLSWLAGSVGTLFLDALVPLSTLFTSYLYNSFGTGRQIVAIPKAIQKRRKVML